MKSFRSIIEAHDEQRHDSDRPMAMLVGACSRLLAFTDAVHNNQEIQDPAFELDEIDAMFTLPGQALSQASKPLQRYVRQERALLTELRMAATI